MSERAKRTCLAIILAAGEGTRMRSAKPKVMHQVAGLAMLGHVLGAAGAIGARRSVVVGPGADEVRGFLLSHAPDARIHEQRERLGTAHAVLSAREDIAAGVEDILVLYGDTPLLSGDTLARLRQALADGAEIAVLGFHAKDPTGYGRLLMKNAALISIREEKDASPAERLIDFVNGGVMALAGASALEILSAIGKANAKGEYYLTDAVGIAHAKGRKVVAVEVEAEAEEVIGVNTGKELAAAEFLWQQRARGRLMQAGVRMIAPETVFLSHDTQIGADAVIEPNVVFGAGVSIAGGARIRSFSHIEGAQVGSGAIVGPFARLRPGADIAAQAHIGNFVEIKNSIVGEGAKVNHLSYIGDADIGAGANIGAGTITCNYDGYGKYRTEIGAGAFIGSNSALVAPVMIGEGAYVGSGSVITKDVAPGALAVARGRQTEKPGWAARLKERMARRKPS